MVDDLAVPTVACWAELLVAHWAAWRVAQKADQWAA